MGFFNRGMYFNFLYQKAKKMSETDRYEAVKVIDAVINETYGIPIIVYHEVSDKENQYCISEQRFRWQMSYLHDNNYHMVTYKDLREGRAEYKEKNIIITFDDAREGVYKNAGDILKEWDIPIMLFVAPTYQNEFARYNLEDDISKFMSWKQINSFIKSNRVEIGAHSYSHFDMSQLSDNEIIVELEKCNEEIGNRLGITCHDFAFPYGRYRKESLSIYEKYYCTVSTLGSGLNFDGMPLLSLRRTAVLGMFSEKDFINLLDYSSTRNKFLELRQKCVDEV